VVDNQHSQQQGSEDDQALIDATVEIEEDNDDETSRLLSPTRNNSSQT
jgi:hypothetical protein